jgi:DNA-binding CsgD family transcriptional regulator/tetratricopeptide (TPR) repeat protein
MTGAAPALEEREDELERLDAALHSLVECGTGGVIVLEGPPGIGKTALLRAVLDDPAAGRALVLRASGSELESRLSFGAVRELLGPALHALSDAERERLLQGAAALARPVLGLPGDAPEGDPLYGLFWLAAALGEQRPLLLVVDDLHWLDEESARFLHYLARRVAGLPILLLASARIGEPVVAIAEHGETIRLAELSPGAVGRLVPERPAEEVHRVTGGNPLLAVELRRALAEAPDGVPLEQVAPKGVARAVLERVERVSPAAVALARAIALSPEPLALADAAALAELDVATARVAADALVRAQVLCLGGGGLGFLHPLMRTAVYEELEPLARRGAHTRAAGLLADRGADVETIASHLVAGEPAGDPESVRILVAAADRALVRAAPRAAARYLERALAEPPAPRQRRVAMRHELGRLQASIGPGRAIATLQAALDEAGTPEQRADIAVDLADACIEAERFGDALALLTHMRDTVELDAERRLAVDSLMLTAALEEVTEPARLAAYAKRIPQHLPGDTRAQRRALIVLAYYALIEGRTAADALALVERAAHEDDIRLFPQHVQSRMRVLSVVGDIDGAEALALELLEHARATGTESVYASAQLQLAVCANQRGDLRTAEAALRLGLQAPGLLPQWRTAIEDWMVTTLSMQGRFEEAEELLDSLVGRDLDFAAALLDRRRMELAFDRGDFQAALGPAARAYEAAAGRIPRSNDIAPGYALALAGVGRAAEAVPIGRRALEDALELGTPQTVGIAHHALGHALESAGALEQFERSVAVLRDTPFRWNLANSEVALGAALRRDNQRARAREVLESALEYAVVSGAAPIEARAREELRLCGARPRRVMRSGIDALTPAEERIAHMAASGMSNKEIAQRLFVTVKNIEMHLVVAYRKLDVSSRRELPGVLAAQTGPPGLPARAGAPR